MSTTANSPFLREAVRLLASAPFRSLARRICPSDYEDVLQDAALKCVVFSKKNRPVEKPAALVAVIVRNEAFSRLTAAKAKHRLAIVDPAMASEAPGAFPMAAHDGPEEIVAADASDHEDRMLGQFDHVQLRALVHEAVTGLRPEELEQTVATYWLEIPVRQRSDTRAKVDGRYPRMSFGLAASRGHRAKEKLRAMPEIAEAYGYLVPETGAGEMETRSPTGARAQLIAEARKLRVG